MGDQDLRDFVSSYPSGKSKARIVVSDRNAEFRQRVAAYAVDNPASVPTELLRDLIEHASVWSRSSDDGADLVPQLLSHLLDQEGAAELTTLLGTFGHNMDFDGHLQTGGLTLAESTRDALKAVLEKLEASHWRVLLAKRVVDSACSPHAA